MIMSASDLQKRLGDGVFVWPHPKGALPVFVEPADPALASARAASVDWLETALPTLEDALPIFGAICLRGFPVRDSADFAALVGHFHNDPLGYSGGAAQRTRVSGTVFETTKVAPHIKVTLHQEMAYLPRYPRQIAFYCRKPADTGGQTILSDMRKVVRSIDPAFHAELKHRGLIHVRNFRAASSPDDPAFLTSHKTWMATFDTDDPRKAEADCDAMGLEHDWLDDGSFSVTYRSSGFARHPRTGEELWFNQLQSEARRFVLGAEYDAYVDYYRGRRPAVEMRFADDGTLIDPEHIVALMPAFDTHMTSFAWRAGDVMLVDNIYTAHGRNPFTGSRDVQVALNF